MPLLSVGATRFAVVLIPMVAALSPSTAQTVAPPLAASSNAPGSPTPEQVRAIAVFRPHVEQVCKALYVRPDASENCVQRVLDATLPLAMEPAATVAPRATLPAESRGNTVAPDGRE
jgi:hypothetical protein